MSTLINDLMDVIVGTLTSTLLAAGTIKGVKVIDDEFEQLVATGKSGSGKLALPFIGVGYAGSVDCGPIEGGGLIHNADLRFGLFAVKSIRGGADAMVTGFHDLVEAMVNELAGKWPYKMTRAGALELDDEDQPQLLANNPFAWRGDRPLPLGPEAHKRNLRGWTLAFTVETQFTPERDDVEAMEEPFEEIEVTTDPLPDEVDETPDDDKPTDEIEFE